MGRTLDTIKEIVAGYLNVDASTIKDDDNMIDDLGLDSLDSIELIINIEEKIGIELSDDELAGIKTIGELAVALDRKLAP